VRGADQPFDAGVTVTLSLTRAGNVFEERGGDALGGIGIAGEVDAVTAVEAVGACAAFQGVGACAAFQGVGACAALQCVDGVIPNEVVIEGGADQALDIGVGIALSLTRAALACGQRGGDAAVSILVACKLRAIDGLGGVGHGDIFLCRPLAASSDARFGFWLIDNYFHKK